MENYDFSPDEEAELQRELEGLQLITVALKNSALRAASFSGQLGFKELNLLYTEIATITKRAEIITRTPLREVITNDLRIISPWRITVIHESDKSRTVLGELPQDSNWN